MTDDRWRIAVHEAGHAAASMALGGRGLGALRLFADGRGLAAMLGDGDRFGDAVVALAGPGAECLAARHDPPHVSGPEAFEAGAAVTRLMRADDSGGGGDWMQEMADGAEPDAALADRFICRGRPSWLDRRERIERAVDSIIRHNETAIIAIAEQLYRNELVLPSELAEFRGRIAPFIEAKETDMLDTILSEVAQRALDADAEFRALAREIADGNRPNTERVQRAMADASKNPDDLRRLVVTLQGRDKQQAALAELPELERQRRDIGAVIAEADADLQAAREIHEKRTRPAELRLRQVRAKLAAAESGRKALIASCIAPDLLAERAELNRRLAELNAKREALHPIILAGDHARWQIRDFQRMGAVPIGVEPGWEQRAPRLAMAGDKAMRDRAAVDAEIVGVDAAAAELGERMARA